MSQKKRTFDVGDRSGFGDMPLFGAGESASVAARQPDGAISGSDTGVEAPKGSITGVSKYGNSDTPKTDANCKFIKQNNIHRKIKKGKNISFNLLTSGVDTLRVYVSGEVRLDVQELLEDRRLQALADKEAGGVGLATSLLPVLCGGDSVIKSYGAGGYAFLLDSESFDGKIMRRRKVTEGFNPMPAAFFTLRQAALWRVGWREACKELGEWIRDLFEDDAIIRVSRVDICADLQGFDPNTIDHKRDFVTRADTVVATYETGSGNLRQFAAGKSNHLRASLYNKGKDVDTKGKSWQRLVWDRAGYEADASVYRLEYQCGSELLRERGIDDLDDLVRKLPGLWSYCLSWCSLRVPDLADSNRSRWEEHEVWYGLRLALTGMAEALQPRVTQAEQVSMRVERAENALVGHLLAHMLLHAEDDPERALGMVYRAWKRRREAFGDGIAARMERKRLLMPGLFGAALQMV